MKPIILHLNTAYRSTPSDSDRLTLILTSNFAVTPSCPKNYPRSNCVIQDGVHNNGGWYVRETYEEVMAQITAALDKN
jgi:hypothetical protein